MGTKRCTKCGEDKPLTAFHKAVKKNGKQYRDAKCRLCVSTNKRALPNFWGTFTPNRSRVKNGVGIIELTNRQDETIAEALMSADDLPRVLAAGRWHLSPRKHTNYVSTLQVKGTRYLHRFLMDAPAGKENPVDHINGNGLDNRRENLRLVTVTQNLRNKHKPARATSGVRNVHWESSSGKWLVRFSDGGKTTRHGLYATIEEAAAVAERVRAQYQEEENRPAA